MSVLSNAAYIADTPDAYFRGLLAGKPGQRATGREVLRMGLNRPGLDAGDVGGFLAEVLLSPTNLVGGWAVKGLAKALGRQLSARQVASTAAKLRPAATVAQEVPVALASKAGPYAAKRHVVSPADYSLVGLTKGDRQVVARMKDAGADLGRHYQAKWDPVALNVINPESGLSLFKNAGRQGESRLGRMVHRNVEVSPGAEAGSIGDYVPETVQTFHAGKRTLRLPTGGIVRFNRASVVPFNTDELGHLGTHEFAHYLTNGNALIHPDLFDRLMEVGHRAARVRARAIARGKPPRTLRGDLTPQRLQYLSKPTEMLARVATTRMASEGMQPSLVNRLLQRPETAVGIADDTADLVEAFGPKLTKYLLRVAPTAPLAAALGVGVRENRQAI